MADREQAIRPPIAGEVRNEVVLAVGGNDVANNDPVVRPQEAGQQNLQPDMAAQLMRYLYSLFSLFCYTYDLSHP